MRIQVTDSFGTEVIGNSREELVENLEHTSSRQYRADVLDWFDQGHTQPYAIDENEGVDLWEVIPDIDLCAPEIMTMPLSDFERL